MARTKRHHHHQKRRVESKLLREAETDFRDVAALACVFALIGLIAMLLELWIHCDAHVAYDVGAMSVAPWAAGLLRRVL